MTVFLEKRSLNFAIWEIERLPGQIITILIRRMNMYIYKGHREIRTRCRTG